MIKFFFILTLLFYSKQSFNQVIVDSLIVEFSKWRSDTTDCMYYKDSLFHKLDIYPDSKSILHKLQRKKVKAVLGEPDKSNVFSFEYIIKGSQNCPNKASPLRFRINFIFNRVRSVDIFIYD